MEICDFHFNDTKRGNLLGVVVFVQLVGIQDNENKTKITPKIAAFKAIYDMCVSIPHLFDGIKKIETFGIHLLFK